MYPNMQKFYLDQQEIHGNSNKRMIEAVRSNPNIKGCIHALIAGDWILGAGLIDYGAIPKMMFTKEQRKVMNHVFCQLEHSQEMYSAMK